MFDGSAFAPYCDGIWFFVWRASACVTPELLSGWKLLHCHSETKA
jgi:hypothetical protein